MTTNIDLTKAERDLLAQLLDAEYKYANDRRYQTRPDSPEEKKALDYQRSLELISEKLAGRA